MNACKTEESLFVYFFSPLCPYCVESTPILNEIANEVGVEIRQLNVLEDPEAFNHYSFESTPTLIYFEQGEEKSRLVGGIADEGRQELAKQFLTENMQQ